MPISTATCRARPSREGTRQRLEISLDFLVLGTAQVKIFPQGFQFLRCKRHEIGDRRRRDLGFSLGRDLGFVLDPDMDFRRVCAA
jgi:hypothetical protein